MGVYYIFYTEAFVNGKWECICDKVKCFKTGKVKTVPTMWGQSFMRDTYNKLLQYSTEIKIGDTSEDVRNLYDKSCEDKDDIYNWFEVHAIDWHDITMMMANRGKHEYSGYVWKQYIYDYESGDLDDIYERMSPEEYSQLPEDEKIAYAYYEWDSLDGWHANIQKIIEHVRWQLYSFEDANYICYGNYPVRIIMTKE